MKLTQKERTRIVSDLLDAYKSLSSIMIDMIRYANDRDYELPILEEGIEVLERNLKTVKKAVYGK